MGACPAPCSEEVGGEKSRDTRERGAGIERLEELFAPRARRVLRPELRAAAATTRRWRLMKVNDSRSGLRLVPEPRMLQYRGSREDESAGSGKRGRGLSLVGQ